MKKLEALVDKYSNHELRNNMFNKMIRMESSDKEALLCRLFGLMETYHQEGKSLSTDSFFAMIESRVSR